MTSKQKKYSISIGNYNTYDTWGLIPTEPPVLNPPEVKTNYVDIPYYSKRYDFTEALQGSTPYGPRTGDWQFYGIGGDEELHQQIIDAIHGKRNVIGFGGLLYNGRVEVSSWTNHTGTSVKYAECTLSYNIDPPGNDE